MMMNDENNLIFTIDYDKLMQTGIRIQHYLFLLIFDHEDRNKLLRYYNEQFVALVRPKDIDFLFDKGLIEILRQDPPNDPDSKNYFENYTLKNMFLSKLYYNLFEKKVVESAIEDLQNTYPVKTPLKKRRLQSDPNKWKPQYLKIIKGKPELHELILKCIKAEAKVRKNSNSEEFWPLLTTYLNNNRWEQWVDEAENLKEEVSRDYDL